MSRGLRYASISDLPAKMRKQVETSPASVRLADAMVKAGTLKPLRKRGRTSKLEVSYGGYLEFERRLGNIRDFQHHAITLLLGDDCRYTADYVVTHHDDPVIELREVKGPHAYEDSIVKLKTAATIFPYFRFVLVTRGKDGHWHHRTIKSPSDRE